MSGYIKTSLQLPPQDVELETMDSMGNIQRLIRKGNLYWFTDMSMYVYYVPMYWRTL